MAERRSIGDAMTMTPEKLAFIKGQATASAKAPTNTHAANTTSEKTVDLKSSDQEGSRQNEAATGLRRRSHRAPTNAATPSANDLLNQFLVPVTIRLHHRTAQALKRAYLEQKLKHAKPDTLQDIGEAAIAAWLSRAGYLDD